VVGELIDEAVDDGAAVPAGIPRATALRAVDVGRGRDVRWVGRDET
jgi:hypothetical protein